MHGQRNALKRGIVRSQTVPWAGIVERHHQLLPLVRLCPAEDLGLRATPLLLRRSAGMIAIRGAAPKLSQAEILLINQ
jgi:hypothetical protein